MKSKIILNISGVLLSVFAVITLFVSTSVIFDLFDIREKEGNYVLFVVIANFICAFLYLIAAYGFFTKKIKIARTLIFAIALLIITFIGLVVYIYAGGVYEDKTIYALIFRTFISLVFLFIAVKFISKKPLRN